MKKLACLFALALAVTADAAEPDVVAQKYSSAISDERMDEAMAVVRPSDLKELAAALRYLLASPQHGPSFRKEFANPSVEFERLSDVELAAEFFHSVNSRLRQRGSMSSGKAKVTLLGSVTENANTVHFVQRIEAMTPSGEQVSGVSVLSVVREGERWCATLPENLQAMSRGLVQMVAAEKAAR
jgi:hypothetical protein